MALEYLHFLFLCCEGFGSIRACVSVGQRGAASSSPPSEWWIDQQRDTWPTHFVSQLIPALSSTASCPTDSPLNLMFYVMITGLMFEHNALQPNLIWNSVFCADQFWALSVHSSILTTHLIFQADVARQIVLHCPNQPRVTKNWSPKLLWSCKVIAKNVYTNQSTYQSIDTSLDFIVNLNRL